MSNALARLRRLTRDPLLVRTPEGMLLTARARELSALVPSGLAALRGIFADPQPFNPVHAQGAVTIAMADAMAWLLAPTLLQQVEQQAPQLVLDIQRVDQPNMLGLLAEGRCDLAIGHIPRLPPRMYATDLLSQSIVVVRSATHPTIRSRLTLDQYCGARHVSATAPNQSYAWVESAVSDTLRALGRERVVGARVNSILLAPPVVARTAMLSTLPAWLARHYARLLPLKLHSLPFETPVFKHSLVWHERSHRQGLHQWIRDCMRQAVVQAGLADGRHGPLPHVA